MLALRATDRTSGLKLENVSIPSIGPNDVLVKVVAAGITPGVLKLLSMGRVHVPTTVGHEIAGTIAAVGENVPSVSDQDGEGRNLAVGSRVRVHAILNCKKCTYCVNGDDNMCQEIGMMGFAKFGNNPTPLYDMYHDGGAAEYVKAPYWQLDILPDHVSFATAAKIHDAATALRVLELARLRSDSVLLLTAPTGTMGVLTLRLAQNFPIKKIILVGRSKERLEAVSSLTPVETEVIVLTDPKSDDSSQDDDDHHQFEKLREAAAPNGVHAIIDYIPRGDLIGKLLPTLVTGGTLVHMGGNYSPVPDNLGVIMANCWTMVGSRAHTRKDAQTILKWLSEGRLHYEDLITHRFSLLQANKAIAAIESREMPMWLNVIEIPTNTEAQA